MPGTLHIFIDESYGPSFFVFAVVWTYEPKPVSDRLTALRVRLLKDGKDLHQFHATDDNKHKDPKDPIPDKVIGTITAYRDWKFVAHVVDLDQVHPFERPHSIFYPKHIAIPLRYVLRVVRRPKTKGLLIITDNLPGQRVHEPTVKGIKEEISQELRGDVPYRLYHHPNASNAGLQVADYCAYAIRRKYEDANCDYYDRLRSHLDLTESRWPLAP